MNLTLSYQLVQDLLDSRHGAMSAAGAHGALSGMLCLWGETSEGRWLGVVFADADGDHDGPGSDLFDELFEQTVRLLEDTDFAFDLFLPDDDVDLGERASALGEWCEGFLLGLAQGGGDISFPQGCEEVVKDLAEIARLDAEVAGEADEAAFTEICEFVRVGVQLIRDEFLERRRPKRLH